MHVWSVHLLFMHHASFHVDTSAQVRQLTEVEEPEAEYPQEQQQEPESETYEFADQEPECTNFESQQGKHQCILTQCLISVKYLSNLCIKFIGIILKPSCIR